jgi:hypothetical protein
MGKHAATGCCQSVKKRQTLFRTSTARVTVASPGSRSEAAFVTEGNTDFPAVSIMLGTTGGIVIVGIRTGDGGRGTHGYLRGPCVAIQRLGHQLHAIYSPLDLFAAMLPLDAPVHEVLAVVHRDVMCNFTVFAPCALDTFGGRISTVRMRLDAPGAATSELVESNNANRAVRDGIAGACSMNHTTIPQR